MVLLQIFARSLVVSCYIRKLENSKKDEVEGLFGKKRLRAGSLFTIMLVSFCVAVFDAPLPFTVVSCVHCRLIRVALCVGEMCLQKRKLRCVML